MSCSDFDWKAYVLEELPPAERKRARDHAADCASCADELERLHITRAALMAVPDEEMPRRIAFVSDKVFEPNWWQRLWSSAPRLGFVSAAMLSIAILVSAVTRPVPATAPASAGLDRAQVAAFVDQEVQKMLQPAVSAAVAGAVKDVEARNEQAAKLVVAATERRLQFEHRAEILAIQDDLTLLRKRLNQAYVASNRLGGE